MGTVPAEIDANFYNLIHQLVGSPRADRASEQRRDRRQDFLATQRIALWPGPDMPDESEFVEVCCHDLSRRGFSFFLPSLPSFDRLIAAFGLPPEAIYLAARVSHCQEVLLYDSGKVERVGDRAVHVGYQNARGETATPMVLVGCRFTQRLAIGD